MTRLLLFAVLLPAAPAVAAPVPKPVLTAEQEKEFNDLWDSWGRVSNTVRLHCRLVSQPDAAVEYLRRVMKPAELSEKEAKQLIADLGSKDEATWKRAYRDLYFRDVRLAMPLSEALDEATTEVQKARLTLAAKGYCLWYADRGPTVNRTPPRRPGEPWEILPVDKDGYRSAPEQVFDTFEEQVKHAKPLADGEPPVGYPFIAALERINTPAARRLLGALSDGRDGAKTTRDATAALDRLRENKVKPKTKLDDLWRGRWNEFSRTATADELLDRPDEAVKFFKAKLRPVTLTTAGAKILLAKLFGDDKKEVLAAVRELQIVDLQLQMSFEELWKQADTPTKRCRLVGTKEIWADQPYNAIPDDYDIDAENKQRDYEYKPGRAWQDLKKSGDITAVWRADVPLKDRAGADRPPGRHGFVFSTVQGEAHSDRWYHEECAIYVLDVIGTDDAITVIKDMATGHPDAGPTKAAKDVLKRRGVK